MKTLNIPLIGIQISKASLVSVTALAIATLLIPFFIRENTIYTTQYIFGIIVIPIISIQLIDIIVVNHTKIMDWTMTAVILLVSAPVLICFGLIALFIIIILPIPRVVYFMVWLTATVTVFMLGVSIEYNGSLPKTKGPFIFAANHGSFLDYFLIVHAIGYKRKYAVVYGTNLHKYPILNYFLKKYCIGVDRTDKNSRVEANQLIKDSLSKGTSVVIFPEGTRMRSFQINKILLPFRNGAFTSSIETGVPIATMAFSLPILFSKPDKPLPLSPQKVSIDYGPVIYPNDYKNVTDMRESTHTIMKQILLDKN